MDAEEGEEPEAKEKETPKRGRGRRPAAQTPKVNNQ